MTDTRDHTTASDAAAPDRLMRPITDRGEWKVHARTAYERLVTDFADLGDDEWSLPTPCDLWDVRDLGGHVLASLRSAASLRETMSVQREVGKRVKQTGINMVDAMSGIHVERTADLSNEELVDEMSRTVDAAVRGRWRLPATIQRTAKLPVEILAISEKWSLDYLNTTILTRDSWLHRVDLADAVGRPFDCDDHDAAIVGDVAVEWARRHGEPVRLRLTGAAGGVLDHGEVGPVVELDAVQFCRILSGRAVSTGPLLDQQVPF